MGLTNVNSTNRCPFCGNNTYCAFLPSTFGPDGMLCKRIDPEVQDLRKGDVCEGLDGNLYIYKGMSGSGFTIFEHLDSYMGDYEAYISQGTLIMDPAKQKASVERKRDALMKAPRKRPIAHKLSGASPVSAPKYQGKQIIQHEPLSADMLDRMNRFCLSQLSLDEWHSDKYLHDGWNAELLMENLVRTSPQNADIRKYRGNTTGTEQITDAELAARLAKRFGEDALYGFPGFYVDRDGNKRLYWPSGITFPITDKEGRIVRMQVRMDFMDICEKREVKDFRFERNQATFSYEGEGYKATMKGFFHRGPDGYEPCENDLFGSRYAGKYRVVASGGFNHGTPSQSIPSVVRRKGDTNRMLAITEGVPKGIFSNYMLRIPFACVLGVGDWSKLFDLGIIDDAVEKGAEMVLVAYDADAAVNRMVAKHRDNLEAAILKKGIKCAEVVWDEADGKGLDDLLAGGNRPKYRKIEPESLKGVMSQ